MYAGVLLVLAGEALIFPSRRFVIYILAFFAIVNLFILLYEEPALSRKFGDSYMQYCQRVSRWIPRLSS
jgi:protein-S-isoprenylcysteine O-methyltransferase Ste14